jgi:hypothetical protein
VVDPERCTREYHHREPAPSDLEDRSHALIRSLVRQIYRCPNPYSLLTVRVLTRDGRRGDRPSIDMYRRSPIVDQLKALIDNWILIAQGLLASVGALAFVSGSSPCTSAARCDAVLDGSGHVADPRSHTHAM